MAEVEEDKFGSCEGPDAMYVKLVSSDGHEFIIKREHALTSGTIKAMLSGPGNFEAKLLSNWRCSNLQLASAAKSCSIIDSNIVCSCTESGYV